jgi:glutamine amidotransferase
VNVVTIIDSGLCNLDSIARAVEECGGCPRITSDARDLELADRIILPGVGAFPEAMRNLRRDSLDLALHEQVVAKGIPFLGICLGMQLMATKGHEGTEENGLGWIEGEVERLEPDGQDHRIPHIGWNEVHFGRECALFRGIPSDKDMYFVHSYHLRCRREEDAVAHTPYCGGFVSAVQHGSMFGVQFHPEKSQRLGLLVLRNFLSL